MAIGDSSRSESERKEEEEEEEQEEESESSEKSISEERGDGDEHEEEETEGTSGDVNGKQGISEYEKQRLRRMAENKARMEALGLRKMASSLMGSFQKSDRAHRSSQRRGKRKDEDEDEDYTPNDNHGDGLDDDVDDDDLDDEDFVSSKSSSKPSKNKVKNKGSNHKKKVPNLKNFSSEDYIAEDNSELMHAIALSLNDCLKNSNVEETKGSTRIQEDARRIKRKKLFSSRVKMTEDELVLNFFQFDEAGKGIINLRDLRRMATANDFTWTDKELADMIYYFDSNGDGKLNLDDFRRVVSRCNMIQGAEEN